MHRPHLRAARQASRASTQNYSAKDIIATFNTWAFKREQPSCPVQLEAIVEFAIWNRSSIDFVLYWGKGPRHAVSSAEQTCLDYLSSMAQRIAQRHRPGARFNIVFTDTHARLNGHCERSIEMYFNEVERIFDPGMFHGYRLSNIVDRLDVSPVDQEQPDPETLAKLEKCAAKWFRGEGSADEGARRYFALNMIEKRAIEAAFPRNVFVTFNGSEYRSLFPDQLPVFYMYSMKKGFAVKPWFIPDRPASNDDSRSAEIT